MTDDDGDLTAFEDWLRARGRSSETASEYRAQVRLARAFRPLTARMVDPALAPNSRRLVGAALRAYAAFTRDAELRLQVEEVRLPRAEAVTVKQPLTTLQWHELRRQIAGDGRLKPAMRAALLLICRRGFRAGAVCAFELSRCRAAVASGTLVFSSKQRVLQYSTVGIRELLGELGAMAAPKVTKVCDLISPKARADRRVVSARHRVWTELRKQATAVGMAAEEMHPHRLRHTIATEFYRETRDLVALRDYMGWADIKTADRYVTHLRRGELDEIAARVVGDD